MEATITGTHSGILASPAGNIPPTGRSVSVPFANVLEVRGGKTTSSTLYFDQADLVAQLGIATAGALAPIFQ